MANPDQPTPFAAGFMDDYYAEAEEHIVAVRRSLLRLEAALGSDLPADALEELFRSFHSLKGISAMVELREPELLAHHMESCLRVLRQGEALLTASNFETLLDGARALEDVIASYRNGTPLPSITVVLDRLKVLAHDQPTPADDDTKAVQRTAPSPATRVWRVTFTPSPALVARGIKVDTIRTRLLQIGHVLNVAPKVVTGGGVSFEFEVATDDESSLTSWRNDGIAFEALAPTATGSSRSSSGRDSRMAQEPSIGERPRDSAPASAASFVRVDLARLDDLMRLVGDMVVTRARLEDTLERIERHVPFQDWRVLQEHTSRIERQLRDLREGVMRVRLVPVGEIFRRMPYVVRDLARDSGKRVRIDLIGQDTEIDKFLIERMMDPILHLVRNAISHAIESPEQRLAAGKPQEGTIRLSATTSGESVVLDVSDDGSGIDLQAVAQRAHERGMTVPEGHLDNRTLLDIISASGFSTRDEADRASGRGVGMAVVRSTVEGLGGTLAVATTQGRGTTFTITLPLTLAITDAIIAHVGSQTFALPQSSVREVIEVDPAALRSMEKHELLTYRGGTLPMIRLSQLFSIAVEPRPRLHAIVVGSGLAAIGLVVDRIAGQQEIVVKTITDPLIHVDGVSGATELGDGRLVLILDAAGLSRTLRTRAHVEGIPA